MEVAIRAAQPFDAEHIIAYIRHLSEEPNSNMELSPGEFTHTVEEEKEILADFASSPNSLFLVAEVDRRIVGILNCKGSKRAAIRHVVSLGMSVDRDWRRCGIGARLLGKTIEWARNTKVVTRIELSVFERNQNAIHLHEKFGFVVEGEEA